VFWLDHDDDGPAQHRLVPAGHAGEQEVRHAHLGYAAGEVREGFLVT
jgi:hypothetical protein